MYGGVDRNNMSVRQRKIHRDQTLQKNPDVLFRIFNALGKLQQLHFKPNNPNQWSDIIPQGLTFQLTMRSTGNEHFSTIIISGPQERLVMFSQSFPQHLADLNAGQP